MSSTATKLISTVPTSTVPIYTVPTSTVPIYTVPISTVPIYTVPIYTVPISTVLDVAPAHHVLTLSASADHPAEAVAAVAHSSGLLLLPPRSLRP